MSLLTRDILWLFHSSHPSGCKVVSSLVLICLSLMTNDVEYLFLCLWVIGISLKKCPFISLHILIEFLLLSCKSLLLSLYISIQSLYQSHDLHIYPFNSWVLFAISSLWSLQHESACYYLLFHFLIMTAHIILVKGNFTARRGSGMGMPTAILKWQWFLVELPLFLLTTPCG